MALATLFVLTVAAGAQLRRWHWLLQPLGLEYLRTLVFILLIAGVVQFTELMVRATSPLLHQVLGIFLPLITTNCAVLGVALLNVERAARPARVAGVRRSAGAGFGLVLLLFAALRERLETRRRARRIPRRADRAGHGRAHGARFHGLHRARGR